MSRHHTVGQRKRGQGQALTQTELLCRHPDWYLTMARSTGCHRALSESSCPTEQRRHCDAWPWLPALVRNHPYQATQAAISTKTHELGFTKAVAVLSMALDVYYVGFERCGAPAHNESKALSRKDGEKATHLCDALYISHGAVGNLCKLATGSPFA